jgi:hypothetical protein
MGLASIERFRTIGCRSSNADKFSLSFPALNFALFAVNLQLTPGFRIEAFCTHHPCPWSSLYFLTSAITADLIVMFPFPALTM